jgi:hypothetical protein
MDDLTIPCFLVGGILKPPVWVVYVDVVPNDHISLDVVSGCRQVDVGG